MDKKARMKRHKDLKPRVLELAEMGVSDTTISKELNIGYAFVQRVTTTFWKDKMNKNINL